MRSRASSLVLAGVLLTSGGAFAVANTTAPAPATGAVGTAEASPLPSPTPDAEAREARTPPGQAKKNAKTAQKPGRGPAARGGSPGGDEPGRAQGRGPDATCPAAYGLCRAWAEQEDPGDKAERVPPFRNLAAAAGGVDNVDEYCAALPERPSDDEGEDEDD